VHFPASLAITLVLCAVHLGVHRFRPLQDARRRYWLSLSAGTAIGYVFAYLLPKLGLLSGKLAQDAGPMAILLGDPWLLALLGLLVFYLLDRSVERTGEARGALAGTSAVLVHLVGYGAYSAQLGYLVADLRHPGPFAYLLVALILALHQLGLDHHLRHRHPDAWGPVLRWSFVVATLLGWAAGAFTDFLERTVTLVTAFVAGGILITAIREELPREGDRVSSIFLAGVVVSASGILVLRTLARGAS